MRGGRHVAVVMPARDEEALIQQSIDSIPGWVDLIVVVDDGSIDATAELAKSQLKSSGRGEKCGLVTNSGGIGVGGAISAGYREVISLIDKNEIPKGNWAAVVMAGDGQMDPDDIDGLLERLDSAPFVKGDRWLHQDGLGRMPRKRRLGSRLLSKLTSLASGRKVSDPQCGFTAVDIDELRGWKWASEWQGYGYPNWWMLNIGADSIPFESAPIRSVYRNETSGIRLNRFLPRISILLFAGLWRRGWTWYVAGGADSAGRRSNLRTRIALSICWFGALAAIIASPLFVTQSAFATLTVLAVAAVGLSAAKLIDRKEVNRRLAMEVPARI
uniref:Glycosyl transferase n=1 Tax=uncultured marine group II/III euryarchaeote KM3_27_D02 TaxID=1456428 RepID=A0A075GWG9_9EURY|nr:glycosyl transferase [uncultured marine group II/III euryarchaeote KM3_27_D02]